jgi:hypothetical protein
MNKQYKQALKGHENRKAILEVLEGWTEHTQHSDHTHGHIVGDADVPVSSGTLDPEHAIYFVARDAHWNSEPLHLFSGEHNQYATAYAPGSGWDALPYAIRNDKVRHADDKAAFPYMYDDRGRRIRLDGRQAKRNRQAIQRAIRAIVPAVSAAEPVPQQYAERTSTLYAVPRDHRLVDGLTGALAVTGWECAPVRYEAGDHTYVAGHPRHQIEERIKKERAAYTGGDTCATPLPATPLAKSERFWRS